VTKTTRGNLVPATIYEVNDEGKKVEGGLAVDCMFNPFEYSVSKTNSFTEKSKNQGDVPQAEFSKAGSQTLKLNLVFDTYEASTDVSLITRELWKFMMTKGKTGAKQDAKVSPPQVAFEWGFFRFVSFITNMTQRFTLFKPNGMPVRAKVDVTFTQYVDVEDYKKQNPTSGGGPIERVRRVSAGDRLDLIADEIYGDSTKWRLIADYNRIHNPLNIKPGQILTIPFE
jgi:nucleoid-associated protein YgaU